MTLVFRYKRIYDEGAKFSPEQVDFINGLMRFEKLMALACRYDLAIGEAIETTESDEQRIRDERLAAAGLNRALGSRLRPSS